MKISKKIVSLLLVLAMLVTLFSVSALFSSAKATSVETIKADLYQSVAIKDNDNGVSVLSTSHLKNGVINVNVATGSTSPFTGTGALWLKAFMSLKDTNGEFIRISSGYKYAINVVYTVTQVNSNPSIAIIYNNADNSLQDNGSNVIKAETKTATGRYVLSATVDGVNNRPLRLAFGGNGVIAVEAVIVEKVANNSEVKNVNYVDNDITTIGFAIDELKTPEHLTAKQAVFGGWYKEAAFTNRVDTVGEDGATYYAKWTSATYELDLENLNRMANYNPGGSSASNTSIALTTLPAGLQVNVNKSRAGTIANTGNGLNDLDQQLVLEYADYDVKVQDGIYNNYIVMQDSKRYAFNIKYSITSIEGTVDLGIVSGSNNLGYDSSGKILFCESKTATGTYVMTKSYNSGDLLDTKYGGSSSIYGNKKLRLAFEGKGTVVIESITVQEIYVDDANTVGVKYVDNGLTYTAAAAKNLDGKWEIPAPVVNGDVVEKNFGGYYKDSSLTTPLDTPVLKTSYYPKWNYVKTNVNLSDINLMSGGSSVLTITKPTADSLFLANFQRYDQNLFNEGSFEAKTTSWLKTTSVSLEYFDCDPNEQDTQYHGYAAMKSGYTYCVTVKYNVVTSSSDTKYHSQIAVISNATNLSENAVSKVHAARKHASTGNGFVLSAVVDGSSASSNKLRLAFGGAGKIEVESITITQINNTCTDYVRVNYYRENVGTEVDYVKPGTQTPVIENTEDMNFAGWFSGEDKVVTINSSVSLTATYTSKYDANFNFNVNICDLVHHNNAVSSKVTNSSFDINRDGVVDNLDTAMLRSYLLGLKKKNPTINGYSLEEYTIVNANSGLLLNDLAADALAESIKTNFGKTVAVGTAADDKNIYVGVDTSKANDAAINNLVGVNGDVYSYDEYKVFMVGNNVYIEGGSDFAVSAAAQEFVEFIAETKTFEKGLYLIGTADNSSQLINGYKRVYTEEFNGQTINTSGKWWFKSGTVDGAYYDDNNSYYKASTLSQFSVNKFGGPWTNVPESPKYADGKIVYGNTLGDNYSLVDGAIVLNSKKTSDGYTATELCAAHSYKYGIMTARVKFDTTGGATSSVWAKTDDNKSKLVNEFDFVENYGNSQAIPNLHIWDNREDAESAHIDLDKQIDLQNTVKNIEDAYHDIAMIWTAEKIQFYFDGVLYLEQDITDKDLYEAFHESTRMVFSIGAASGYYSDAEGKNGLKPGDVLGSNIGSYNENLTIDYIRWYQK